MRTINELIGKEYICSDVIGFLNELYGTSFKVYDEGIDNGCRDDEEDDYVLYTSFESERGIDVKVYYGDNTRIIGYVDVD